MTETTRTPTAHVVTKAGRVVVIFWGDDAGEEATAWVRPHVTAGSGASLTVTMTARRTLR